MALNIGYVTVDPTGTTQSSVGLSGAIYDSLRQYVDPNSLATNSIPDGQGSLGQLKNIALMATGIATAVITHFQINAQVVVSTTMSGLQTLPSSPMHPGDDTAEPATTKYLPII